MLIWHRKKQTFQKKEYLILLYSRFKQFNVLSKNFRYGCKSKFPAAMFATKIKSMAFSCPKSAHVVKRGFISEAFQQWLLPFFNKVDQSRIGKVQFTWREPVAKKLFHSNLLKHVLFASSLVQKVRYLSTLRLFR